AMADEGRQAAALRVSSRFCRQWRLAHARPPSHHDERDLTARRAINQHARLEPFRVASHEAGLAGQKLCRGRTDYRELRRFLRAVRGFPIYLRTVAILRCGTQVP